MTADAFDARRAVHASALLATFNAAGVLSSADVHVATRLARLTREDDERVVLAVALAVRGARTGSVCVRLDDAASLVATDVDDETVVVDPADLRWPDPGPWLEAVRASPLVAAGVGGAADRPARLIDGRLYLDRYWRDEQRVRRQVDARLAADDVEVSPHVLATVLQRLFPAPGDSRQRLAAAATALSRFTVLTGGPGTGKTTTVARVLATLQAVSGGQLRIALAAPTGKAAARLQEAVRHELGRLDDADRRLVGDVGASTVHRLLGWRPGSSTRFRHDASHHLPHDLVVVDETSMVSLPLMARLLEAVRPQARVLLVGDPDQLASVEAGAVLGDLVARAAPTSRLPERLAAAVAADLPEAPDAVDALRAGVVRLEQVHRHGEDIGALAAAVREGRADDVLDLLRAGGAAIDFVQTAADSPSDAELAGLRADVQRAGRDLVHAARGGDVAAALTALDDHRLLLAHRRGAAGVAHWAPVVQEWVDDASGRPDAARGPWFAGRPLLVTANDRDSGLYNGDTGVVVADGEAVVAAFGDAGSPLLVRPHRLPAVETVYAMTVHRGQGSQFARVSVLLPPATSPLLTRELLYTAVTRARHHLRVVGTAAAVRAAVERPVRRASGLREP
ncbi:exodeoxyribonuclease V subunit alpha [Angustibacter sp. Root456]|uniref:exodeoxyribonuclease V subunit alpha n=1 Tax=Angustibacter sp. Root456 TaxID=1736539 RepID=UPI0006FA1A4E|nr:exodeoxyribonuclease V subunit alpha [Angustibacter sp. Root456]KQX69741.1 exodeoxyribonuclease V subunit alpha [Angustibacter sp. Root456]